MKYISFAQERNVGGFIFLIEIIRTSLIASTMLTVISFGGVDDTPVGLSSCSLLLNICLRQGGRVQK